MLPLLQHHAWTPLELILRDAAQHLLLPPEASIRAQPGWILPRVPFLQGLLLAQVSSGCVGTPRLLVFLLQHLPRCVCRAAASADPVSSVHLPVWREAGVLLSGTSLLFLPPSLQPKIKGEHAQG